MNTNDYLMLSCEIEKLLSGHNNIILAIDGRCASGKTTLAYKLQKEFCCNVIHMDDFYLPINQRESDWQKIPAKNIDFNRLEDIIKNISHLDSYRICPYLCSDGKFGEPILYHKNRLTVIEGSYSCHPVLKKYYHYCVFMDITSEEQKKRLLKRNGEEGYQRFQNIWIPLEEAYFEQFSIRKKCDLVLKQ